MIETLAVFVGPHPQAQVDQAAETRQKIVFWIVVHGAPPDIAAQASTNPASAMMIVATTLQQSRLSRLCRGLSDREKRVKSRVAIAMVLHGGG
jgi:isocitrate/isopropylmalate dehydrogenase